MAATLNRSSAQCVAKRNHFSDLVKEAAYDGLLRNTQTVSDNLLNFFEATLISWKDAALVSRKRMNNSNASQEAKNLLEEVRIIFFIKARQLRKEIKKAIDHDIRNTRQLSNAVKTKPCLADIQLLRLGFIFYIFPEIPDVYNQSLSAGSLEGELSPDEVRRIEFPLALAFDGRRVNPITRIKRLILSLIHI